MKHSLRSVRTLTSILLVFGSLAGGANAAVVVTISNLNASSITYSVSGTVDAGGFANRDRGTFLLSPYSPDLNTEWSSTVSLVSSNITIGSITATVGAAENGINTGDALYFYVDSATRPGDGTTVSGSATLSGSFNLSGISTNDFKLYLGLESPRTVSSNQLIATAVPEPSGTLLLGLGAFGIATRRRRFN